MIIVNSYLQFIHKALFVLTNYYHYYYYFYLFIFLHITIIVPEIETCGLFVCTEPAKQSKQNNQNIPGQIAEFRYCSWP